MDDPIQKAIVPTDIIRHAINTERLRQAYWAFNIYLGLTSISGLVGIAAVGLLFSGRVSEGTFTAAGGGMYGAVTISCWKLTKDANDRLDEALRTLEEES
jgi:hypothetical protein